MIAKITISPTSVLSADIARPNIWPPKIIEKEAKDAAIAYEAFSRMLSYVQQYPDTTAIKLFNMFLAPEHVTVRAINRRTKAFTSHGITITEYEK